MPFPPRPAAGEEHLDDGWRQGWIRQQTVSAPTVAADEWTASMPTAPPRLESLGGAGDSVGALVRQRQVLPLLMQVAIFCMVWAELTLMKSLWSEKGLWSSSGKESSAYWPLVCTSRGMS